MRKMFIGLALIVGLMVALTTSCAGPTLYEENVVVESGPISPTQPAADAAPLTEAEPIADAPTPEPTAIPEPALLDPAETVEAFYQDYVDYVGNDFLRTENNPLVDGVYRDSPYLSPRLIREIDDYVAAYNPYGYDPLLMAEQIPSEWTVGAPVITSETAVVEVSRTWDGLDSWLPQRVQLVQVNGRWLIDDLTVVMTDGFARDANTPEKVVEAFYTWYLAYTGSPAAGEFRSPLSDHAYADLPYLTPDLVAAVDTHFAQMQARQMGGADPFLCAQNIPISVFIPDAFIAPTGTEARVLLRHGFYGPHYLVLALQAEDGAWRIDNIECASMSPAGTVDAFYTWYLGYIGDRADGEFRNPLVDGAYRESPFLTENFVQQVNTSLANMAQGGFDPFLQAQDIPHGFMVQSGPGGNEALVEFYFLDEDNEPDNSWRALVTLVEENGRYQIDAIDSQNVPDMAQFTDEEFGFSFLYPADWVAAPLGLSGPGMPDDWPVAASWQVMPADVAEQIAAQSGPPDPNAPPVVASFQVDVVVGDETAVSRAFLPLDNAEIVSLGRKLAYVLHMEPGYSHQIFPHPFRPDTWIVITDWVTEFPGREVQGQLSRPVLAQLQNSLQFEK